MSYYKRELKGQYFTSETRSLLAQKGVRILSLDEANNSIPIGLFSNVVVEGGILALPSAERTNFPIPYEALDHDDHKVAGKKISQIIEEFVDATLEPEKYIFSARPDVLLALEFKRFSYELLFAIHSGNLTTPILLTSKHASSAVFFEFDLAINTVSVDKNSEWTVLAEKPLSFWTEYFNQNFLDGIVRNENHLNIINNYYHPKYEGLRLFD